MDTLFSVKMTFPHYLEGQCSLTRGPPQLTGDLIISPQNRRCEQEHGRMLRSVWGGQLGSTCYSVVSAGRICSPASRHPASRQAARPTNTCHSPAAATHGSIASSAVRTLAPATEPSLNQFHFIQFHITFDFYPSTYVIPIIYALFPVLVFMYFNASTFRAWISMLENKISNRL